MNVIDLPRVSVADLVIGDRVYVPDPVYRCAEPELHTIRDIQVVCLTERRITFENGETENWPLYCSFYRAPPIDPEAGRILLSKISDRFDWLQREDLTISTIYLNPIEVAALRTRRAEFDELADPRVRAMCPGRVGLLWGALVYESPLVPEGRIVLIPGGLEATLTSGAAAVVL